MAEASREAGAGCFAPAGEPRFLTARLERRVDIPGLRAVWRRGGLIMAPPAEPADGKLMIDRDPPETRCLIERDT